MKITDILVRDAVILDLAVARPSATCWPRWPHALAGAEPRLDASASARSAARARDAPEHRHRRRRRDPARQDRRASTACSRPSRAAAQGVDFDSIDGQPTHLFFLLVVPEHSGGQHLKALARISRFFRDAAFRERLARGGAASRTSSARSRRRTPSSDGPAGPASGARSTIQATAALVEVRGRGRAAARPQRHRQERVRARARDARPPARRGRRRGARAPTPTARLIGAAPGADPPLHGDPRASASSTCPTSSGRRPCAERRRDRPGRAGSRAGARTRGTSASASSGPRRRPRTASRLPALLLPARPAGSIATLVEVGGARPAASAAAGVERGAAASTTRAARERRGAVSVADSRASCSCRGLSGSGKTHRDGRARGPRLLLRRQPAGAADRAVRRPVRQGESADREDRAGASTRARRRFLAGVPGGGRAAPRDAALEVDVLFLDCADEVLVQRYRETRRVHPLAPGRLGRGGHRASSGALLDDVARLADLRARHLARSTSTSCKRRGRAATSRARREPTVVNLISFGFRYGTPPAAELLFDVRFLPNPHFEPALRARTGLDPDVGDVRAGEPARRAS